MYFDDKFIESLPEDIASAITAICKKYFKTVNKLSGQESYTFIKEALGFVAAYSEANSLGIDIPTIKGDTTTAHDNADQFFQRLQTQSSQPITQIEIEQYKNMYAVKLGKVFHYEFSEGDLKLIQKLIKELRELIAETKELKEEHKRRLLSKLEKVQSELHKRVSNLDRVWGFIIEASIVLRQVGENVKPLTDRIRELVSIVLPAQNRAYELPSNLPLKLLGQVVNDKSKDGKS